ncbi:hypothetical protein BJ986_001260 [Phycicoccus badiiscoriae]|uniref:Uncharacterized protein n=1 Tax=Pedococcus badiiscoriae TaxID=642776 RepID=A0A852WCB0_9MICO|nr:hypothetical protein [Pedococcus badiiscoriae]
MERAENREEAGSEARATALPTALVTGSNARAGEARGDCHSRYELTVRNPFGRRNHAPTKVETIPPANPTQTAGQPAS